MITVDYLDHAGDDLAVVNAARVSHADQSDWGDDGLLELADEGLLRFLARGMSNTEWQQLFADIRHYGRNDKVIEFLRQFRNTPVHKSPFNHAWAKFRVTMPVFTARQLVKHEYMPWNERSGRYEKEGVVFDFYWPEDDDWRAEAKNVKQGSGEPLDPVTVRHLKNEYAVLLNAAERWYNHARRRGLCAEQARMGLPQSMMTTVIWSGTLHAIVNMLKLRTDNHSQKEARDVAHQINGHMTELFPVSVEALMKGGI